MKKQLVTIAVALAAVCAQAQTLDAYLKLRKSNGIFQAASVEALDTFVGTKILEIRGIVKGSIRSGKVTAFVVERADGSTSMIETTAPPEWLVGNEVSARLLVRARRGDENGVLHIEWLGAAPEDAVHNIELAEAKKLAAKRQPSPGARHETKRDVFTPPTKAREWIIPASEVTPIYAAYIKKINRKLQSREAMRIAEGVVGFSIHYGVDARLIMALMIAESDFNPRELSRSGAMGLGQLMPGTAKDLGVSNPYDLVENVYGTVKLLSQHLKHYRAKTGEDFQSLCLALAAYNAGPGAVARAGGVPPFRDTQRYVKRVVSLYKQFAGLN